MSEHQPERRGGTGFHELRDSRRVGSMQGDPGSGSYRYRFENFFHPYVGEMIEQANHRSIEGLLDPVWQEQQHADFFTAQYGQLPDVTSFEKNIDVSSTGPYANYNWELLFHAPLSIATHLSNNQRFAEAQRWFHYIFDPTSTDTSQTGAARYWRFLRFRQEEGVQNIVDLVRLLSTPDEQLRLPNGQPDTKAVQDKYDALTGYGQSRSQPFQPHVVAASRPIAYQYHVVMKYLDNLIAWGDSLFREDSAESINEATQRYVLAKSILGPRPQQLPRQGTRTVKSFLQLRDSIQEIGNVLVDLENQFPFNLAPAPPPPPPSGTGVAASDWITRAPYFCVPRNERMLAYWDRVEDRLYKIRNSMNLDGTVRQLALFEPSIDPGLLVRAAAAGLDVGAVAAAQRNPAGPARATALLALARQLCDDVRSLGAGLLAAIEKEDAEAVAVLRQDHEVRVQERGRDVRYLLWRQAQAATNALVQSREQALERHRYYLRLVGLGPDPSAPPLIADPDVLVVPRSADPLGEPALTEKNFDAEYQRIVGSFDRSFLVQRLGQLKFAEGEGPGDAAGVSSSGKMYLNVSEGKELNDHLPVARDLTAASAVLDTVAGVLRFLPELGVNLHFFGLGINGKVFGGDQLATVSRIAADVVRTASSWERDQAAMAARTATYERRAEEWILHGNLAAHELRQLGRQVLAGVIGEQAAHREYLNAVAQIGEQAEVAARLRAKLSNQDLYAYMRGELTRLYHDHYRFALDVARKAEVAVKQELMEAQLDEVQFVRNDYWNPDRKGLLAAESLLLDLRRLDLAYLENRRRELELVRHVSLTSLDPMSLVRLREEGWCEISIPEAVFDLACPGHYLRRLKRVSVSIPAVTGPYTSVSCTLSLLRSSVRKVATGDPYASSGDDDPRFEHYSGAVRSIVTSRGWEDDGMFEGQNEDDMLLPFEGAGAISTWRLELPDKYRQFDYNTITDVVLHLEYTARDGGAPLRTRAVTHLDQVTAAAEGTDGQARLFSMRLEFPDAWARFASVTEDRAPLTFTLRDEHYPFWSAGHPRETIKATLLARTPDGVASVEVRTSETGAAIELGQDVDLGDLCVGELGAGIAPVGETTLWFDAGAVTDAWLVLEWGTAA